VKEFFTTKNQEDSWSSSISTFINLFMVISIMINLLIDHKVGINTRSLIVILGLQVSLMTDIVREVHSTFILSLVAIKGLVVLATAIIASIVLPEALAGGEEIGAFALFLFYVAIMLTTDLAGIIKMIMQRRAEPSII